MLSTCAVFVWQSRHRGVAQFGRAPRSGRGGRGFKSRHLDQRDAGLNFALGSALFISSAQLCVAQLCSAHRTKALQWVKVPMRDAGPKFALGSASLFVCTVVRCATVQCAQDEWFVVVQGFTAMTPELKSLWVQRYFYVCSRTRGLRMHIFAARRCMKYIKKDAKLHFYLSDRLVSI